MRVNRYTIASALLATALCTPSFAQVNNGGFETAPTTPVTPNDWQYNGAGSGRDSTHPHSGQFEANLNNVTQASNANVQQQTAFGSITPGQSYPFSFWAQGDYGVGGIGQAQFAFMNSTGGILGGFPQFINIPASSSYQQFTQSFTAPAGASAAFIAFNAVTGAVQSSTSHLFVDDVRLGVAPEPATITAIVAPALLLRRRRRA